MSEFKTLRFSSSLIGQAAKVRALKWESEQGWRVVSETVSGGQFKAKTACCLFFIFAPCAFCAGNRQSIVTVTLQRDTLPVQNLIETESSPGQI